MSVLDPCVFYKSNRCPEPVISRETYKTLPLSQKNPYEHSLQLTEARENHSSGAQSSLLRRQSIVILSDKSEKQEEKQHSGGGT